MRSLYKLNYTPYLTRFFSFFLYKLNNIKNKKFLNFIFKKKQKLGFLNFFNNIINFSKISLNIKKNYLYNEKLYSIKLSFLKSYYLKKKIAFNDYNFNIFNKAILKSKVEKEEIYYTDFPKGKLKKKNDFSHLTKKELKKMKIKKYKKLVRPDNLKFKKFFKLPRNQVILPVLLNKKFFVHDGYSWQLLNLKNKNFLNFKSGSIAFKTRALSPISIRNKGVKHLDMKQKSSFKIKTAKVKRKK